MKLKIRVIPNSSKNQIVGWIDDETLKVKISAPAEKGKANKELLKFLTKELKTGRNIFLVSGFKDRNKLIELEKGELPPKPLKLI
ncbi:MAG: DUF167 domain-containing protein [Candidatus Dojkabacteria bacterium]|jgi:uncharacterized protein (TIGR00251 family)|nr:DUF167 domain-containing protein [Candidatus Dojkabacteria bacterium]